MTKRQIRERRDAQPFRPFDLCLNDGTAIPVEHPDYLFLLPEDAGNIVVVWHKGLQIIDTDQVNRINMPGVAA